MGTTPPEHALSAEVAGYESATNPIGISVEGAARSLGDEHHIPPVKNTEMEVDVVDELILQYTVLTKDDLWRPKTFANTSACQYRRSRGEKEAVLCCL
jgi:hypothetical protein